MKDILHFSHANGFPGGSYQVMFDSLAEHYDVRWTDRIGHNPAYPITNNWPFLLQEMIDFFEKNYTQPVIAVGHSLGGLLSMRIAAKRPDLVKAVVILDVPALSFTDSVGVKILKRLNKMDKITPAGKVDGRREVWASEEEAIEYFKSKHLMSQFDLRCIEDYVRAGTEPENEGIRLRFDPVLEKKIYVAFPDNKVLLKPLKVPAAAIGGTNSNVFKANHAARMQHKLGMQIQWIEGSHMFPLEVPEQTADSIVNALASMRL